MGVGLVELVNVDRLPCSGAVINQTEVKYRALLENLNTSYALCKVIKDYNGNPVGYVFLEVNPAFEIQMGVSHAEVVNRDLADTVIGGSYMGIDWFALFAATAKDGMPRIFEKQSEIVRRWFKISVFSPLEDHIAVLIFDITRQKENEEKQQHKAYYDPLTGLSSQRVLEDRLMLAILQAKRSRERLAVALFNVENLEAVVDSYGQEAGDELLQELARRTVGCLRQSDTVARISEETLALILPGVKTKTFAVVVANRVLEECRRPFVLKDATILPSGTISLCFFPKDQLTFAETISQEDVRLYLSKQRKFPQVCLSF